MKKTFINGKNRGVRPCKRKFRGNQYSDRSRSNSSISSQISNNSFSTAYDKKVSYEIINFSSVFQSLILLVVCKKCGGNISVKKCLNQGLGFKIKVECVKCKDRYINSCATSMNTKNTVYDINSRFIFVMQYLGVGYVGLRTFCGLMDLPNPLVRRSYDNIIKKIRNASKKVCDLSLKKAVSEEIAHYDNRESIVVSGDGSWRKRGFQSLHGVSSLIGNFSGKVLDIIIKSSYCAAYILWENKIGTEKYIEWLENHEAERQKNHEGSSGKMEVDGILEMFSRSEELHKIKYKYYVGDGDSKIFKIF